MASMLTSNTAVQIDGVAYTLIAARNSSGIQIIKLHQTLSITSNNTTGIC